MRPPVLLLVSAFIGGFWAVEVAKAQVPEMPSVVAQRFDDDCGLAALRMLLQRSGIDVSETELAAGLRPSSSLDALSATDLAVVTDNLGFGLRLDVLFLPTEGIAQLAEFEPFLILLKPQPLSGNGVFNHFVLVEAKTASGYLIADPILGERVELSERDMAERTHGREVSGSLHPMILRLSRAGQGTGAVPMIDASSLRLLDWEAAYRQPRLLPQGKTQLTFGLAAQTDRFRPEKGVILEETNQEVSIGFAHGLTNRTQLGLSLSLSGGTGAIDLDGDRVSFGLGEVGAATLSLLHVPRVELPTGLGLVTSAELTWMDRPQSTYVTLGADLNYVYRDFNFGLNAEVLYDGSAYWQLTPSFGYSTVLADSLLLDLSFAAPFDVTFGDHSYEAEIAVSRNFGPDFLIQGYMSYGVSHDGANEQIGVGVEFVYGVPRRFRNSD